VENEFGSGVKLPLVLHPTPDSEPNQERVTKQMSAMS
jgi:hypothetical protein